MCEGVVVSDPAASRRHIQLRPAPDGLVIVDPGSTNGTTINDVRVDREAVARVGDVIGIGLVRIVVTEVVAPRPPDVAAATWRARPGRRRRPGLRATQRRRGCAKADNCPRRPSPRSPARSPTQWRAAVARQGR